MQSACMDLDRGSGYVGCRQAGPGDKPGDKSGYALRTESKGVASYRYGIQDGATDGPFQEANVPVRTFNYSCGSVASWFR